MIRKKRKRLVVVGCLPVVVVGLVVGLLVLQVVILVVVDYLDVVDVGVVVGILVVRNTVVFTSF